MQKSVSHFYNEEFYKRRKFQFDLAYPSLHRTAEALVERFDPKSVLDIGCAKGYLVYAFRELGIEAYGVDMSEYATSQSPPEIRDYLLNADVDQERLPFSDEMFDLVSATEILEHLTNHRFLLSEIRRVLKTRGIAIAAGRRRVRVTIRSLAGTTDFGRLDCNPTHVNRHPALFWIREFESHGFHYIGDLPRQVAKEPLLRTHPLSRSGRLLMKCGTPGRWIRAELAFTIRRKSMLFEKV